MRHRRSRRPMRWCPDRQKSKCAIQDRFHGYTSGKYFNRPVVSLRLHSTRFARFLKDFGDRYTRPIEAETEAEKARVGELRALIEPQKLRRTKAEVAKDLPFKIVDAGCRALPISERQRADYGKAVAQFKNGARSPTAAKNHLGLLLYLRMVCSDPRPPGPCSLNPQPWPSWNNTHQR